MYEKEEDSRYNSTHQNHSLAIRRKEKVNILAQQLITFSNMRLIAEQCGRDNEAMTCSASFWIQQNGWELAVSIGI
jgi:hypothetical protein